MGFELNRLMRERGVATPGVVPYSGATIPVAPVAPGTGASQEETDRYNSELAAYNAALPAAQARNAADMAAYNQYRQEYERRVTGAPQYLQSQFNTATGANVPPVMTFSPAQTASLRPGGIGLDQMNRNIRNWFAENPNASSADVRAAQNQWGLSDLDIRNAMGMGFQFGSGPSGFGSLGMRTANAPGGIGTEQYNKNIRDFFAKYPDATEDQVSQAKAQYGVTDKDIYNATGSYYGNVLRAPTYGDSTTMSTIPTAPKSPIEKLRASFDRSIFDKTPQEKAAYYNSLLAAGYDDATIRAAIGAPLDANWTALLNIAAQLRQGTTTKTGGTTTTTGGSATTKPSLTNQLRGSFDESIFSKTPQEKAAYYNSLLAAGYDDATIRSAIGAPLDANWLALQNIASQLSKNTPSSSTSTTNTSTTNTSINPGTVTDTLNIGDVGEVGGVAGVGGFKEDTTLRVPASVSTRTPTTTTSSTPPTVSDNISALRGLYGSVFGRAPDTAGFNFWLDAMNNQGYTPEMVRNEFLKSPEYLSMQAGSAGTTQTKPAPSPVDTLRSTFDQSVLNKSPQEKANYYNSLLGQGYDDETIRSAINAPLDSNWTMLQNLARQQSSAPSAPAAAPAAATPIFGGFKNDFNAAFSEFSHGGGVHKLAAKYATGGAVEPFQRPDPQLFSTLEPERKTTADLYLRSALPNAVGLVRSGAASSGAQAIERLMRDYRLSLDEATSFLSPQDAATLRREVQVGNIRYAEPGRGTYYGSIQAGIPSADFMNTVNSAFGRTNLPADVNAQNRETALRKMLADYSTNYGSDYQNVTMPTLQDVGAPSWLWKYNPTREDVFRAEASADPKAYWQQFARQKAATPYRGTMLETVGQVGGLPVYRPKNPKGTPSIGSSYGDVQQLQQEYGFTPQEVLEAENIYAKQNLGNLSDQINPQIANAVRDSIQAGYNWNQVYEGANKNLGISKERVDQALKASGITPGGATNISGEDVMAMVRENLSPPKMSVGGLAQKYKLGGAVRRFRLGGMGGEEENGAQSFPVAPQSEIQMRDLPPQAPTAPAVALQPATASAATRPIAPPTLPSTPVSPAAGDLMAMLQRYTSDESPYAADLAAARGKVETESKAFENLLKTAMKPGSTAPDKTELYFRLAAAFGAPTRTGSFGETLSGVGKELSEYAKETRAAKKAEQQLGLQLGLEAQKMRMQGAREELGALRGLAAEEMKDKRAILLEYLKSGRPQSEAGKAAIDAGFAQGTPEFNNFVKEYIDDKVRSGNALKEAMVLVAQGNLAVAQAGLAVRQSAEERAREGAKKLTPGELKLKTETEDRLTTIDSAMSDLGRAYDLNKNSFDTTLKDTAVRTALEQTGSKDPKVLSTREMDNLLKSGMISGAAEKMKGVLSDSDIKLLQSVSGLDAKSKEERAAILKNAYRSLRKAREAQQKRLNEISQGLYRETSPAPAGPGED